MSVDVASNPSTSLAAAEIQPKVDGVRPAMTLRARDAIPWLLGAMSATALLAALWLTRSINPLSADTPSYLYFDPSRTVGYPAFLWVIKTVTGRASLAVPVQMALLAGSLFLLGWSFYALTRRRELSAIFQVVLLCSPELWGSSAKLMTEALATAFIALWCAQLLMALKRPSRSALVLLGIISAAGMLVRPSLVVLFAGSAVAAFVLETARDRRNVLLWLGAIAVGAWALTPVTYLMIRGSPATGSPFARGVLQHTLFCEQASARRDPDATLVEQDSKMVRAYIGTAPQDVQPALRHLYSSPMRFGSIIPALARRHHLDAAWQTDPILLQIAEQRVVTNPTCYGASVLRAYVELASHDPVYSAALSRRVRQFMSAHPPIQLPSEQLLASDEQSQRRAAAELHVAAPTLRDVVTPSFPYTKSPFMIAGRVLFGSAGIIGLIALAALLWPKKMMRVHGRQLTLCLAALGASFHGLFLLTALVELALVRYTVPAWPIVCTLLGLAAIVGLDRGRETSSLGDQSRLHVVVG